MWSVATGSLRALFFILYIFNCVFDWYDFRSLHLCNLFRFVITPWACFSSSYWNCAVSPVRSSRLLQFTLVLLKYLNNVWLENIFTRCIYLLAFMEIAFFSLQISSYSWHSRQAPEGGCWRTLSYVERCSSLAWRERLAPHKACPAEGALAGINDLCAHHGVSTHYYCSLRVSRNIFLNILWLAGR